MPGPDPQPKPKDLAAIMLVAVMVAAAFLVGFTAKSCSKPKPGPVPIRVDAEDAADTAITDYAKALSTVCLEVANGQDSGQMTEKNEVIQYMNNRFAEERPKAFQPLSELLDQDWSSKRFRELSKGFGRHAKK